MTFAIPGLYEYFLVLDFSCYQGVVHHSTWKKWEHSAATKLQLVSFAFL